MEIVVRVVNTPVQGFLPGPFGPGKRFAFSDDLELESIDNKVPPPAQDRRAGTHSGFVTTLRVAEANDVYFQKDDDLLEYEASFRLIAVNVNPPPGLQEGQLTARGTWVARKGNPVGMNRFAITGGTGPYASARGQVTENGPLRTIEIVL
jgi:hypothetical protein